MGAIADHQGLTTMKTFAQTLLAALTLALLASPAGGATDIAELPLKASVLAKPNLIFGIVDSGVVDEVEAVYGANADEWDFYYGHAETDGGRTTSHGSVVAQAIEQTNSALARLDLRRVPRRA